MRVYAQSSVVTRNAEFLIWAHRGASYGTEPWVPCRRGERPGLETGRMEGHNINCEGPTKWRTGYLVATRRSAQTDERPDRDEVDPSRQNEVGHGHRNHQSL